MSDLIVKAEDCYDPAEYVLVHKDHLAKLEAAAPLPASGWQPIETAPKGQRVLAILKPQPLEQVGEMTFVYFTELTEVDGGVWTLDDTGDACEPLLWFQLPDPPFAAALRGIAAPPQQQEEKDDEARVDKENVNEPT